MDFIISNLQNSQKLPFIVSPKAHKMISTEEVAALKFLIQLQAAYNYQVSLRRAQRPRRNLPPVPRFEEYEYEPETQKKVQCSPSQDQVEINMFDTTKVKIEDDAKIVAKIEHTEMRHHDHFGSHRHHSMIEEEQMKTEENDGRGYILSQMSKMITKKGEDECESPQSDFEDSPKHSEMSDKRDMKKLKKLESCMVEVYKKLMIKDSTVLEYGREFLQDIIPYLIELFNKKPFTAIAGAVLIFACYKAQYPMTTKQVIDATGSKETLIIKCFYSIKQVLIQKKNE